MSEKGQDALYLACRIGRHEMAKWLLTYGEKVGTPIELTDYLLTHLGFHSHILTIKWFIRYAKDRGKPFSPKAFVHAFETAITMGSKESAKCLLDGYSGDKRECFEGLSLICDEIAMSGHEEWSKDRFDWFVSLCEESGVKLQPETYQHIIWSASLPGTMVLELNKWIFDYAMTKMGSKMEVYLRKFIQERRPYVPDYVAMLEEWLDRAPVR